MQSFQKQKSTTVILASAYPVEVSDGNGVEVLKAETALGFTEVHCRSPKGGLGEIKLGLPPYGKVPPNAVAIPKYREPMR